MKSFTAANVKLGFVGVGAMGSRVVRRLIDHGYDLTLFDRNPGSAEALRGYGGSVANDLPELATNVDVVLSCLTDDNAVRNVYVDAEGVLAHMQPGKSVLEMSTISPQTSREVHSAGAKRGVEVLDVAISGSTPAVEQGTITLLAGGDAELFKAAEPIFNALATHWFLMGPSGSGTSMKLVVNAILGIGMQAIAEAIALGEVEGLDRQRLLAVLSQTAVISPAHLGKLARAQRNDYSPQFAVGLMNKDLGLILKAARSADLELPATAAAFEVNSAALKEDPSSDLSSVIRHMERLVELKCSR